MNLTGTYDYRLVALSVALALASSYAALDLAGRVTAARGWARRFWLMGGASAMGLGIWAMHYIGMLAFRMPMTTLYDVPTVLLSLLAAVGASAVALFVVSRPAMAIWHEALGSVAMGGGIAAMHYVGMAAMRVPARVSYDPVLVIFSVALSIFISLVAILLTFRARCQSRAFGSKIVSALVMGSAIPLMHYTGMAAASFSPSDRPPDLSHAIGISGLGIWAISTSTFVALLLAVGTAIVDRLLAAQRIVLGAAREGESHFRTMAETIPQMIWTARADGRTDYLNQRWHDYTGLSLEKAQGLGWQAVIHPEDLAQCVAKWERSTRTGETYEVEYRLRRASDGNYRWQLVRALPVRDLEGEIASWFGTCTDIDDQKHHQEILEEQIRQRTAEVMAGHSRLQQEMREREEAQGRLNQQNQAMVEELTRRSARGVVMARMGKLLQSSAAMEEAVPIILGVAPQIFPEFRGALLLMNASRTLLEVAGTWADCRLADASGFEMASCWALRTGQRHLVEAGDGTARCSHTGTEESYQCTPIMTPAGTVGILHLQSMGVTGDPFEADALLINHFVEQIGLSITNLKLQQALRQQSTRDALTGLYNRRYLEESLEREIRRAGRSDQAVGVVMFDIDHFKNFNDTFGHEAGDSVLRELGGLLAKSIRAEDVPCRFGGEEFLLILPGADLIGARTRAERLRNQAKELTVVHQGQSVGVITISMGVTAFPTHGASIQELLASADAALYRAKRAGRDRVMVAEIGQEADAADAAGAS